MHTNIFGQWVMRIYGGFLKPAYQCTNYSWIINSMYVHVRDANWKNIHTHTFMESGPGVTYKFRRVEVPLIHFKPLMCPILVKIMHVLPLVLFSCAHTITITVWLIHVDVYVFIHIAHNAVCKLPGFLFVMHARKSLQPLKKLKQPLQVILNCNMSQ